MNRNFSLNKTLLFVIIVILTAQTKSFSQGRMSEQSFLDQVRIGGSVGLSFNNNFFNFNLAPKAIYDFNQSTSAGAGLLGSYTSGPDYKAYNFGGSIIGLYRPWSSLQVSAEFEELHVSRNYEFDGANLQQSYWYPALFLGLGYTTGSVTAGLRYDVLYDDRKSIYGNALMPFVSVYF